MLGGSNPILSKINYFLSSEQDYTWHLHFYLAHSCMLHSLRHGSITRYYCSLATYSRRDSMLEVMCKLHDISQDFSSLINGVYFIVITMIVIIKKTPFA